MNTIKGMIKDLRREETHIGGCTTKGELIIALESLERSVEISYSATNGDIIKDLFPNVIIENEDSNIVDISISHDNCANAVVISAKQNWWNAPYNPQQNLSYTDKSGANIASQDVLKSAT